MANKKRKVSQDDFLACHAYFHRIIREPSFKSQEGEAAIRDEAIALFLEIPSHDPNEKSIHALQSWIDRFIDAKTWSRCYRVLNQKKYLAKSNLATLQINKETYVALKSFATENQLSFSQAITDLLAIANEPFMNTLPSSEQVKQEVTAIDSPGTNNVVALFKTDRPSLSDTIDEDEEEGDDDDDFNPFDHWFMDGRHLQQPKKPEGYDFKKNDSYKKYRKRIDSLTLKEINPKITALVEEIFSSWPTPTEHNARDIGTHLIKLKDRLLKEKYLVTTFQPNDFAISKTILLPEYQMTGFADDLMYYISLILGCHCAEITSGKREPSVFAGNRDHVIATYHVFHYLKDFLAVEAERFLNKCHKNMKKKNRYRKAGNHGNYLMYEILHEFFDEDKIYQLYSAEEEKLLSSYVDKHVGCYYDENMPIGGWG